MLNKKRTLGFRNAYYLTQNQETNYIVTIIINLYMLILGCQVTFLDSKSRTIPPQLQITPIPIVSLRNQTSGSLC